MPILKVEMWAGRTATQKAELARALTEAMVNIVHCPPQAVTVIFEDIAKENWAVAGVLSSESLAGT